MADRVGQQFGSYRLTRLLGRGSFAEVYLGEHIRLGMLAAIKVLHTSLAEDEIEDFLREAQTVARLKHPHIVRLFDFDVEAHTPFLVMDYYPHGNVRQSHPRGVPLPLTTIIAYVKQVASALQYTHDEKLIHRDIKPENMLLDRDNTIVLSDFGIAVMAQSSRYQHTQEVAGTAAYMAPEQLQGKPRRASDQYALGVVVYEWLSGNRPFHGSFTEIASQHLLIPPPPLQGRVLAVSPVLEQVVLTALAKDPERRFASVAAFAQALEEAANDRSIEKTTLANIPDITQRAGEPSSLFGPPDVLNRATILPEPPPLSSEGESAPPVIAIPANTISSTEKPAIPLERTLLPQSEMLSSEGSAERVRGASPLSGSSMRSSSVNSPASQSERGGLTRRTAVWGGIGVVALALAGGSFTWVMSLSHKQPQVSGQTIQNRITPTSKPSSTVGTPDAYTCVPGTLVASGSTALASLVQAIAQQYTAKCAGANITVNAGGSGVGLAQVEAGAVQIGNSDLVKKPGQDDLVDHQVAVAVFTLIINSKVTGVTNITTDQIKQVYSGQIGNWQQVGGPDLPIVVVGRPSSSGTRAVFQKFVLGGSETVNGPSSLITDSTATVVASVQKTEGAIGYVSLDAAKKSGLVVLSIDGNAPAIDVIKNNIYTFWNLEHMYTKGQPTGLTQAFIKYVLGPAGQNEIRNLQFMAITDMMPDALQAHQAV